MVVLKIILIGEVVAEKKDLKTAVKWLNFVIEYLSEKLLILTVQTMWSNNIIRFIYKKLSFLLVVIAVILYKKLT